MGVTGLWRLVEPAGKPVPVETLENKVLAVDISIWLHQMVKGYQDAKGAPLPNAHLMGLFQRLCKLLYFRIKPVFVFDGGFPELKKETIAKRQDHKAKYNSESERIKRELALLLSKKTAVSSLLGKKISPSKQQTSTSNSDDLFKLPALPQVEEDSGTESDDETNSSHSSIDLHSVDIDSDNFKRLPVKEKYDILLDLKETRKQNSWGRLEELPKQSDNFSNFQMQRLLKRRRVQECLQETEKEMGDSGMSLNDLECLLNEEGIDTKMYTLPTRRIASNVTTRFLLIKDVKKALLDAKKKQEQEEDRAGPSNVAIKKIEEIEPKLSKVDELEDDLQQAIKMSLECMDEPNNVNNVTKTDDSWTSCKTDNDSEVLSTDSEEGDGFAPPDMSCAKAYIMQYSDFTHRVVDEIVTEKRKIRNKHKLHKIDKIIEEINKEKSVIVDNLDLSSSGDEFTQGVTELGSEGKEGEKLNSQSHNNFRSCNSNKKSDSQKDLFSSLDATKDSVICIEDIAPESVSLDTSLEDVDESKKEIEKGLQKDPPVFSSKDSDDFKSSNSNKEVDSSDNEFEEVLESNGAIELTLNMGEVPGEDIFADVFTDKKHSPEVIVAMSVENTGDKSKSAKLVNSVMRTTLNTSKLENVNATAGDNGIQKTANIDTQKTESSGRIEFNNVSSDNLPQINKQIIKNTPFNVPKETEQQETGTISNKCQSVDSVEPMKSSSKLILDNEGLNKIVEEIQNHEEDLLQEKGRLDRVGRNITEQMTKEAQELLQIFGIPYIVAPMEAEAQCAFLETAKLTDGTITDDSDIWLFGGRTVYKNFFNQKKHVLQFQAERIEKSFNLTREQLILLALLVGSDYTTGVTGVGPVTAMEILASFPFNKKEVFKKTVSHARYAEIVKGLQEFKLWVKSGKRTDNITLKKKLKNVSLTEDFPSVRVVQAYLEPNIEKSEDKFTWGELDVTILRDYTKAKFGWSQNKLDEIIKPVLKRLADNRTQRSIQDFFKRKIEYQSLDDQMSKRVKAAVQKLCPEDQITDNPEAQINQNSDKNNKISMKGKAKSRLRNKISQTAPKEKKNDEASVLLHQGVKVISVIKDDGKSDYEVKINKTDHYQEIIPQREKSKRNLLENKMRAIEVFRKTQIDKKRKTVRRKTLKPKENADLSESDSD